MWQRVAYQQRCADQFNRTRARHFQTRTALGVALSTTPFPKPQGVPPDRPSSIPGSSSNSIVRPRTIPCMVLFMVDPRVPHKDMHRLFFYSMPRRGWPGRTPGVFGGDWFPTSMRQPRPSQSLRDVPPDPHYSRRRATCPESSLGAVLEADPPTTLSARAPLLARSAAPGPCGTACPHA